MDSSRPLIHANRGRQTKIKVKVKVAIYSPDIPEDSSDFYINYPQVLELTFSQSHLPGENAAHLLQLKPFTQCYDIYPRALPVVWIFTGYIDRLDASLYAVIIELMQSIAVEI